MADVTSGLTSGDGYEDLNDPNTDLGFNAMLARQVAGEDGLSESQREVLRGLEGTPDRSVESGYTQESSPLQTRDDRGRFAPAAPSEEETPGAAPVEEQQEEENTALREFLERHGGDPTTALEAALRENEEAQKVIGRQGNELGDARKSETELQELRERLARIEGRQEAEAQQPSPYAATPVSGEQIDQLFEKSEQEGWDVMVWASDYRPDLIDKVYKSWKEYYPSDAALWRFRYESNLEAQSRPQEQPGAQPERDPILQEMHQQRNFNTTLEEVEKSYDAKDWELIKPHLVSALSEDADATIAALVASDDAAERRSGMNVVARLARARAVTSAQAQLAQGRQEVTAQTKRAASVDPAGSVRPVTNREPEGGDPAATSEEVRQRLHDALLATETKDVSSGLTYGRS